MAVTLNWVIAILLISSVIDETGNTYHERVKITLAVCSKQQKRHFKGSFKKETFKVNF